MNGDVIFSDTEDLGSQSSTARGQLRCAPDLELSVLIVGAAISRFKRSMRNKRVSVSAFNHFRAGSLERIRYVAIVL